jgi:hypothetical protein
LRKENYNDESLYLERLLKVAAEKDAKYLSGINLGALRKEFPRKEEEDPREYYRMLNHMAADGPYFSSKAIEFIRNNIDEDLVPANRKEFVKWLATELNKTRDNRYPDINDIAMIKDWLVGSGWPNESAIVLTDLNLEYATMASKEWHERPTGPIIVASETEKKVVYSFETGSKIVYEPTAAVDPVARRKLGQKLGLCLRDGLYSDDKRGEIYSIRSSSGKAGACIRIERNHVREIKGPGNTASSITVSNSKMIKEWLKEGLYAISGMGKSDYEKMPPTSWVEAKRIWDKSRANFIRRGWFRGYREEFKPELVKALKLIFSEHRGKDHSNDSYFLNLLLKERVHHVYLNEFSKHLDDIAKNYPEIYLLNNLPKTYSSAIFSKTHEYAVDNLAEIRPNKIIDYSNAEFGRNVFSENITKMVKKREGFAVNKLLNISETALKKRKAERAWSREWKEEEHINPRTGKVYKDRGVPYDAPSSYWQIESLFRNHRVLKANPEVAAKILKNLQDMYPNEDEYPFRGALKGVVRTRLYRQGGIFKDLIEEVASAIKDSLDLSEPTDTEGQVQTEAAHPSDSKHKQWTDLNSFFSLGFHTTKEYKHLTDSIANKLLDEHEKEPRTDPGWNRLAKLAGVSDETKKRVADLYLNKTLAGQYSHGDYLKNKTFYKNPLFLETTIRAIKSSSIITGSGLGSWHLLNFFPNLIKKMEGLIPEELLNEMREGLVSGAKKLNLKNDYNTSGFLRKTTSRKNFPKLYDFIIENSLEERGHSLERTLWKLEDGSTFLRVHDIGNMRWDLRETVGTLHLIRKHDLHLELEGLPDFIRLFGNVNYKLAKLLRERVGRADENSQDSTTYKEQILEHIGVLRMYINFGWHRSDSSYSKELSSAIEEVNKSLFPAIKELYEKELEQKKMSLWSIFGPRTSVDKILNKYYYNDADYPESLIDKDEEFIEHLKKELVKLGGESPRAKEEVFGEFIYGFMYWSVSTFNEMGEEAASQEGDIENYINEMKNVWPKRTGLRYDEFFQKGFNMRDAWERSEYDVRKPVPYDEEEVADQLDKDYMEGYYQDWSELDFESDEDIRDRHIAENDRWLNEQQEVEAVEPVEVEDEYGEEFASAEPVPLEDWRLEDRQARFRKLWMLNKFSI